MDSPGRAAPEDSEDLFRVEAPAPGIATDEDVMGFFDALPNKDKQVIMVAGQAHNTSIGINRARFWHVLNAFLTMPPRVDE